MLIFAIWIITLLILPHLGGGVVVYSIWALCSNHAAFWRSWVCVSVWWNCRCGRRLGNQNEPMIADIKCLSNVRRANAQPFCSCSRHIQCRTRSHCVILLNCFFLSIVSLSLFLSHSLFPFSSLHRYKTLIRMTHAHWQANVPSNTWLI